MNIAEPAATVRRESPPTNVCLLPIARGWFIAGVVVTKSGAAREGCAPVLVPALREVRTRLGRPVQDLRLLTTALRW